MSTPLNAALSLAAVGVGGATGAMLRYAVGLAASRFTFGQSFPLGTLLVNWLGCLAIGLLAWMWVDPSARWKLLLVTGVLGGFTTFSAFALETATMIDRRQFAMAAGYVLLTNAGCIGLAMLGMRFLRPG